MYVPSTYWMGQLPIGGSLLGAVPPPNRWEPIGRWDSDRELSSSITLYRVIEDDNPLSLYMIEDYHPLSLYVIEDDNHPLSHITLYYNMSFKEKYSGKN